jgi:hypothetical protein
VTLIASLRGWPKNPAWYYNLRKHPDVVCGGLPFRAEIVENEAERQRLWDLADRVYPPYADFRAEAGKAGRVIPTVQLVPRQLPAPKAAAKRQRSCRLLLQRVIAAAPGNSN